MLSPCTMKHYVSTYIPDSRTTRCLYYMRGLLQTVHQEDDPVHAVSYFDHEGLDTMTALLYSVVFLVITFLQTSSANSGNELVVDTPPAIYDAGGPRIENALLLLKSQERERFAAECMTPDKFCSRDEVADFIFHTEHVQNIGEDWFWHTYVCMRQEDAQLCPVDGGWAHWGPWGNCSVSCGRGTMSRHRHCTHPTPEHGGRECSGSAAQVSDCETHIPCLHHRPASSNITLTLLSDMLTYLRPFHKEDIHLKKACLFGHCSYQQVLGMIQPVDLANRYWSRLNCYKYFEGCPVAGGWSSWGEWSPCTSRCGTGQSFRSRHCNNPYPSNGGQQCLGPPVEEKDCFQDTCADAVGIFLTPWSPWTSCSEGCDQGTKVSTRRCHGSDTCSIGVGNNEREVRTLTRRAPCMMKQCPLLGGWNDWGEWSTCSTVCGSGYHIRVRACGNPLPIGRQNECAGEGIEKGACMHQSDDCDEAPENREYGLWSTWSQCSSSCEGGVKMRHRSCLDHQTIECTGPVYNTWPCNVKLPCPVDGDWSEWSSWTTCSVTCGMGETMRYRLCSNPVPSHGGKECEGERQQTQKCKIENCPRLTPQWGTWGAWDECSESCEGGTKSRQRWCLVRRPAIRRMVRVRMTNKCAGEFQQFSVCNTQTCPVDGSWANWGAWTTCSSSCGEGMIRRDRSCTDPAPVGKGVVCGGYGTETRHCFERPCAKRGTILLQFDGSSFLIYRRSAHPARHLLIFLSFLPTDPHGLLVLRREEEWTQVVMMVRLVDFHVQLYAEIGPEVVVEFEGDSVKLDKWNTLEIGFDGREVWLRVNDGDVTVYEVDKPIPDDLDWDLPMYVGGALPNLFPGHFDKIGGFTGKIAKLRVNYREYNLHESEEWEGGGLPYVSLNVEEEQATDIDSDVPSFTGEEYALLPIPPPLNTSDTTSPLLISMIVRPADGEGIVLYVEGRFPGAFFALGLEESNLVITLSLGHDQEVVQRLGDRIELGKWSLIDIKVTDFSAELRIGKGPATQLTSIGHAPFRPGSSLYVGGVTRLDRLQVEVSTGATRGFLGEILEVTINWVDFEMYETALSSDILVNSASSTVAAHFRDISAPVEASLLLRCQFGHLLDEVDEAYRWTHATWLYNGDRLLEFTPHRKIVPSDPGHPYSASLLLSSIAKSTEGFYACQVNFRGLSVITHAFSVIVNDTYDGGPAIDQAIDIIIVACVGSVVAVVFVVILLAFCAPCRRRSYFLDRLHDSLTFCCGCEPARGGLPPGLTYDYLAEVDASYGKDFSARKEKAKLDSRMGQQRFEERFMRQESDEEEDDDFFEEESEEDLSPTMRKRRRDDASYAPTGARPSPERQRQRDGRRKVEEQRNSRAAKERSIRDKGQPVQTRMSPTKRSPGKQRPVEAERRGSSPRKAAKAVETQRGGSVRDRREQGGKGFDEVANVRRNIPEGFTDEKPRNQNLVNRTEFTGPIADTLANQVPISDDEPWFMTDKQTLQETGRQEIQAVPENPAALGHSALPFSPLTPPQTPTHLQSLQGQHQQPPPTQPTTPLAPPLPQYPPPPPPPQLEPTALQMTPGANEDLSHQPYTNHSVPVDLPQPFQQTHNSMEERFHSVASPSPGPVGPPVPPQMPGIMVPPPPASPATATLPGSPLQSSVASAMGNVPSPPTLHSTLPPPSVSQNTGPPAPPMLHDTPIQPPPPPPVLQNNLPPPPPPPVTQNFPPPPPPPTALQHTLPPPPPPPQQPPPPSVFGSADNQLPPPVPTNDMLRSKIELNRQRRRSTGARFGTGPHLPDQPNINQNSTKSSANDTITTYFATLDESSDGSMSLHNELSLPSGDFSFLKVRNNKKCGKEKDDDSVVLLSEGVDSSKQHVDTVELHETKLSEEISAHGEGDTYICEDCERSMQEQNKPITEDILSNEEDFESCADDYSPWI